MTDKNEKVYTFAPLSGYSFKERVLIRLADWAFYLFILLIGKTVRFEVEGWENFELIGNNGHQPIYAFWHNRIFLATYYFRKRGIVVVTSQSFDGEYIARFIQRFGYGAVRGSSTRGGVGALVEAIKSMKKGYPAGFTVDGPKGPRCEAKPGPVLLAKKTGNPVMPFTVNAEKFWTINSWDKLQVPRPFTKAKVIIAKPLYIPHDASPQVAEEKRLELQNALISLSNEAET